MKRINEWPHWPDARGWIGIGIFALSVMLLWMMKDRTLREDEFFQTIATVIIANGLMAVVAWAYASTKGGGELAERNATIAETVATAGTVQNGNSQPNAEPAYAGPDLADIPESDAPESPPWH